MNSSVLILTANRGTWKRIAGTLEAVRGHRLPDVLLIDESLFAREWTWLYDFQHRRDYAIWSAFGGDIWRPDGNRTYQAEVQADVRCEGLYLTDETPEAWAERVSKYLRMDQDGETADRVTGFAHELNANGVRVATVYVPPVPGGESMATRRPADDLTLAVEFDVEPGLYCDTVHLNEEGRKMFTRELARSISGWLRT